MYKLGRIFSIFLTNFTINKRLCGLCLEDGGGDLSSIVFTKIYRLKSRQSFRNVEI